jgi:hypothetical protein
MINKVTDLRLERRRRRLPKPTCASCGHPADQYHPVGPITVTISGPDGGVLLPSAQPDVRIFCNLECLVWWVRGLANIAKNNAAQPEWRRYRTGAPRPPYALERLARHRAAKLGYRIQHHRSRRGDPNHVDEYLLVDKDSSVVLGAGYTASIDAILIFLESENERNA